MVHIERYRDIIFKRPHTCTYTWSFFDDKIYTDIHVQTVWTPLEETDNIKLTWIHKLKQMGRKTNADIAQLLYLNVAKWN